jgi:hypothetical protein
MAASVYRPLEIRRPRKRSLSSRKRPKKPFNFYIFDMLRFFSNFHLKRAANLSSNWRASCQNLGMWVG